MDPVTVVTAGVESVGEELLALGAVGLGIAVAVVSLRLAWLAIDRFARY